MRLLKKTNFIEQTEKIKKKKMDFTHLTRALSFFTIVFLIVCVDVFDYEHITKLFTKEQSVSLQMNTHIVNHVLYICNIVMVW